MKKTLLIAGLLLGMAGAAMARPPVDLDAIDADMAGPRSQVLVLGSHHLSEHPGGFGPEALEPLLERLEAFAPEVITVESVSGEQCDLVMRFQGVYSDGWERYCFDTAPARAATGLDVPAAGARMLELLRGLPGSLVQALDEYMQRGDETTLVAARLAARLGLERLHPVDDHTGDDGHVDDIQAYGAAIQRAWDTRGDVVAAAREAGLAALRGGDALEAYRQANSPQVLQAMVEGDFGAALADPSPERYGQFYVGGWETRNLRMVANVRDAFRDRPGARVLAIVGATHKPWFDSLLGRMQGVDIVDVQDVLR